MHAVDANILFITNLQEVPVFATIMRADAAVVDACVDCTMLVSASFCFIIADNLYSSELDRLLIEPNFY